MRHEYKVVYGDNEIHYCIGLAECYQFITEMSVIHNEFKIVKLHV